MVLVIPHGDDVSKMMTLGGDGGVSGKKVNNTDVALVTAFSSNRGLARTCTGVF